MSDSVCVCFFCYQDQPGPRNVSRVGRWRVFCCARAKVKVAWICVLWWVLASACALTFLGWLLHPNSTSRVSTRKGDVKGIEMASILVRNDIYIYIGWFLWIQGVPGMKHVEAPLLYPHILIIWCYDIPSTIVLFLGRHCPDEWSTCWGGQDGSLDIGLLGSIGFLYSFFRKAGSLLKKVWFSFALVIPDIIIGLRYHARLGKAPS